MFMFTRVLHELGGLLSMSGKAWDDNPISSEQLTSLLLLRLRSRITGRSAKILLSLVFNGDVRPAEEIAEEKGLIFQPMSADEYLNLAEAVMESNVDVVKLITEKGAQGKIKFLVGQMIKIGDDGRLEAFKAETTLRQLMKLE